MVFSLVTHSNVMNMCENILILNNSRNIQNAPVELSLVTGQKLEYINIILIFI